MVVLNAKTIFQNGTYRGVKPIAVRAPSLRAKLTRKAKAQEGTASASGAVPVLTDHVLALQGAIGDIRDFATCFTQHFFERMLSNEDLAPSATDDMDEEGEAWEHIRKMGCCFDLLAIATSDTTATTSESEMSERHKALHQIHTWAVNQGQMEIQEFDITSPPGVNFR
jgi:hypothetical protein